MISVTQKGKIYECRKCTKELLITREGSNPSPPFCCGRTMSEVKAKF